MKLSAPRPVIVVIGYLLVITGLLGIVLPLLPTWIFLIPGIVLLGEESKVGAWFLKRIPAPVRKRFAKLLERVEKKKPNP